VLARAAVTLGNDSDEYLTRDPEDGRYQDLFGAEIASGQRRLSELAVTIGSPPGGNCLFEPTRLRCRP
jgi:hypothetical protein